LVHQGKPTYYRPHEMAPTDVPPFEDKVPLEQAASVSPIERGHLVVGWIQLLGCEDFRDTRLVHQKNAAEEAPTKQSRILK
jgi:hypothetical protein